MIGFVPTKIVNIVIMFLSGTTPEAYTILISKAGAKGLPGGSLITAMHFAIKGMNTWAKTMMTITSGYLAS